MTRKPRAKPARKPAKATAAQAMKAIERLREIGNTLRIVPQQNGKWLAYVSDGESKVIIRESLTAAIVAAVEAALGKETKRRQR